MWVGWVVYVCVGGICTATTHIGLQCASYTHTQKQQHINTPLSPTHLSIHLFIFQRLSHVLFTYIPPPLYTGKGMGNTRETYMATDALRIEKDTSGAYTSLTSGWDPQQPPPPTSGSDGVVLVVHVNSNVEGYAQRHTNFAVFPVDWCVFLFLYIFVYFCIFLYIFVYFYIFLYIFIYFFWLVCLYVHVGESTTHVCACW